MIARAGICAAGLGVLIALAGCGSDDDSKSDDAGKTDKPSRGFQSKAVQTTPGGGRTRYFHTHLVVKSNSAKFHCTSFFGGFEGPSSCTGAFVASDDTTPPFSRPQDGDARIDSDHDSDTKLISVTLMATGETGKPFARLNGTMPIKGRPKNSLDFPHALTITEGNVPNWTATNVHTDDDADKAGEKGGPLNIDVTRPKGTVYDFDIRGWLLYDVDAGK